MRDHVLNAIYDMYQKNPDAQNKITPGGRTLRELVVNADRMDDSDLLALYNWLFTIQTCNKILSKV